MTGAQAAILSRFRALGYRDFRIFFVGAVSSYSGYGILTMAIGWLVFELTSSEMLLGVVTFSISMPSLFLGFIGGVLADSLNRRWLIFTTETISMVLVLVLATLTALGVVTVWHIIPLALLRGTASAINIPTQNALLPSLVGNKEITNAVVVYNMIWNSSRILGPAMGGALISIVGAQGSFYAAGLLSLVMAMMILAMRPCPTPVRQPNFSFLTEITEGLTYIRHNREIMALIVLAATVSFFGLTYIVLLPVFAKNILQIGPAGLGMLMTSTGVGALVGSITIASLGNFGRRGPVMLVCALGVAIMLVLFASSRSVALSIPLLAILGAVNSVYVAITNALLLVLTEEKYRGRVMSLYNLTWGLLSMGSLPSGAIANVLGAPFAVTLGAVVTGTAVVVVAILAPSLRKIN